MKTASDQINDYINSHPRECLWLVILVLGFAWQSVAMLMAVVLYVFLCRLYKCPRLLLLGIGGVMALTVAWIQRSDATFVRFLLKGFHLNYLFWWLVNDHYYKAAFNVVFHDEFYYIIAFPYLIVFLLSLIDSINKNPHDDLMKKLQRGIDPNDKAEVPDKKIEVALRKINDQDYEGTVLGVSKYTGKAVVIPDRHINQVALVLGTTGSGKTVTLQRFYQRAMRKRYPLIIVDGKPDDTNIEWLQSFAKSQGRPFFGFNCANHLHYNPLAQGNYTELKDKIICLKDEWESDYYRSIAEDYLQASLQVLLRSKIPVNLKQVSNCLNYNYLLSIAKNLEDEELMARVASLENYKIKDITGLQAHLNILIYSELGSYFDNDESSFSLSDVIKQQGVVYFALPALTFPSFSKVLGKLVINDIKALINRENKTGKPIFTVFDEFSVFAGEQVLNLVNMGRGKGVHAIFGTQGLADLDRVDAAFKSQVLNCVNTLICHRLNDQESAQGISNWIGTRDAYVVTSQLTNDGSGGAGSVRRSKEFVVHPDAIKQGLGTGEVVYVTKVGGFEWGKVRVIF